MPTPVKPELCTPLESTSSESRPEDEFANNLTQLEEELGNKVSASDSELKAPSSALTFSGPLRAVWIGLGISAVIVLIVTIWLFPQMFFAAGVQMVFVAGIFVLSVIDLLIGALFLRFAIAIHNRKSVEADQVAEPSYPRASGIVFARAIAIFAVNFTLVYIWRQIYRFPSKGQLNTMIAFMVFLDIWISVYVLSKALPTTRRKSLNIVGMELVMNFVLGVILGTIGYFLWQLLP